MIALTGALWDKRRGGGICPWSPLCLLLRAVLLFGGLGWPQCEPRAVCPGLQDAIWADCGWGDKGTAEMPADTPVATSYLSLYMSLDSLPSAGDG